MIYSTVKSTSPEDKLKLYRKLLSILDDIKTKINKINK